MTYEQALQRMEEDIRLRGLAEHTVYVYVSNTRRFLEYCNQPINELTTEHIREYLKFLIERGLAPGTIDGYSAGIRFFFAVTLDKYLNYLQIPRMKKPKKLPVILSRAETEALLATCTDSRDKAFLLLAYGSGLRIGETVRLKVEDIRSKEEMRIFVRDAKGQKDRFTILAHSTLIALRDYWRDVRPVSSEGYLFPGAGGLGHISIKSVENAIRSSLSRTSIGKRITCHTLRHGFATCLLEDGYSIVQIKELLGHASIKSTTIYLHLADTTKGIVSPADTLSQVASGDNTNA